MSEITYTWEITGIKLRDEFDHADAVVQTYWKKTGTDANGNEGSFSGATPFSSENTENFVPFEQLTEETVLGWIKSVVVGSYEEHVNGMIQKEIDEKANPIKEVESFPWNNSEGE